EGVALEPLVVPFFKAAQRVLLLEVQDADRRLRVLVDDRGAQHAVRVAVGKRRGARSVRALERIRDVDGLPPVDRVLNHRGAEPGHYRLPGLAGTHLRRAEPEVEERLEA